MSWNGSQSTSPSSSTPAPAPRPPRKLHGALAGLLVVVAAGAAALWWFLGRAPAKSTPAPAESKSSRIAEVEHVVVTNAPAAKPAPKKAETPELAAKRARIAKLKAMTKEERMKYVFEEMAKRPINLEPASNRIYATGLEQVMDWIFTTEVGSLPPPLPKIPAYEEAHIIEILANKNEIKETDSERAKLGKEAVMQAKEEFVDFLAEGGEPQEFLQYYHDKLREAHAQFEETRKSVMQVAKEEPEMLNDYLGKVNEGLAEKGIKPVTIPRPLARRLGVEIDEQYLRGKDPQND